MKGLDFLEYFSLSIKTCNAPTTNVDVMKAHTTPIASAKPNVFNGGRGDIMLAKNAATVVITARDSGTDNLAHALSQDSAGSGYCSLSVLLALCKWIA